MSTAKFDIAKADATALSEFGASLEARIGELDTLAESRPLSAEETKEYQDAISELKSATTRARELTDERHQHQVNIGKRFSDALTKASKMSRTSSDIEREWKSFPPSLQEYRQTENKALAEGAPGTGGALVPPEISKEFFDKVRPRSVVLAAGPRILTLEHMVLQLPSLDTGATVAWVAENDLIPESNPTFKPITLQPKKLAGLVVASNELMNDSDPSARSVVGLILEREMATALDKAFLEGDGTANSIIGLSNIAGVGTSTLTAPITLDDIAAALAKMEANNVQPTALFMRPEIFAALRAAKDTTERYLLEPTPTEAAPSTLFGVSVFPTTNLADGGVAGSTVIVASMPFVVVARRVPFELALDTGGKYFERYQTAIRTVSRWDINVLSPKAVELLEGATVTAPVGTTTRGAPPKR